MTSANGEIETSTNDLSRSQNDKTYDNREKASSNPSASHPRIRGMMTT